MERFDITWKLLIASRKLRMKWKNNTQILVLESCWNNNLHLSFLLWIVGAYGGRLLCCSKFSWFSLKCCHLFLVLICRIRVLEKKVENFEYKAKRIWRRRQKGNFGFIFKVNFFFATIFRSPLNSFLIVWACSIIFYALLLY